MTESLPFRSDNLLSVDPGIVNYSKTAKIRLRMLIGQFSIQLLIFFAVAYGITMKVADLLNEHGLKWFKGSPIIFGFLWGIFGALLVTGNNTIANIMLAMNVAFVVRNRLDFLNHQIAASIVIITFLFTGTFSPITFLIFYAIFLVFGSLKDYVDDVLKKKGTLALLNEAMLYYPIPTFIYCWLYGNWIVFWVFLLYTIAYDATKYIGQKHGYH